MAVAAVLALGAAGALLTRPWWASTAIRPAVQQAAGQPDGSGGAAQVVVPEVGPVETWPDEGNRHVPVGAAVRYGTDPPTSGPHYDGVAQPGFYRERSPSYGFLVHNLEHGHVVIYYHPDRLAPQELAFLEELTRRYRSTWDAVLAVPRRDERYVLILTAWRHWQRLARFDRQTVESFVDRFRGRGPEHPVR